MFWILAALYNVAFLTTPILLSALFFWVLGPAVWDIEPTLHVYYSLTCLVMLACVFRFERAPRNARYNIPMLGALAAAWFSGLDPMSITFYTVMIIAAATGPFLFGVRYPCTADELRLLLS